MKLIPSIYGFPVFTILLLFTSTDRVFHLLHSNHSVLINYTDLPLCFHRGTLFLVSYFNYPHYSYWHSEWFYLLSLNEKTQMIKFIQSTQFINRDLNMYHAETNTPASARTSNLNEELGQVAIRPCRVLLILILAEICCL